MSAHFAHQHRTMTDIADAIVALARAGDAGSGARLTQLRLALSRELSTHCGAEASLLATRRPAADPRVEELVRRYHDELLRWRHELIACNSEWPPRRVFEDRRGFLRAFEPIAERLRERVRWEEQEFYPAVLYARAA